jgi:glycosyltransferase involved in cell wall biosynthesis
VYLLSNALYLSDAVIAAIRAHRVPIVLNQNGVFYPAWYPTGWEQENARMAAAYHGANHVFWQSEFCRRCADRFLGVRAGSGEVLFNAVDVGRFKPREPGDREGPFRLLLTGKIDASTGYRLTSSIEGLAAARRHGLDVVLRIAGTIDDGVARDILSLIDRLGLTGAVEFSGGYAAAEAPDIYRAADAYLITKHNDPCPNVVIEAMASGLPILYSASGGVPELVESEAGIGLPVEESFERVVVPDAEAIAEGLARLISSRAAMAVAARQRAVERFNLDSWIARHQQVFAGLVSDGKVAR